MLDHVGIQCADLPASAAFYDAVLAPLGGSRLMDFGVAMGTASLRTPTSGSASSIPVRASANRTSPSSPPTGPTVRSFFDAAVAAGAEVLHEPRLWPEYHPDYYGAFVRDPDGNNVEAVSHVAEPRPELTAAPPRGLGFRHRTDGGPAVAMAGTVAR